MEVLLEGRLPPTRRQLAGLVYMHQSVMRLLEEGADPTPPQDVRVCLDPLGFPCVEYSVRGVGQREDLVVHQCKSKWDVYRLQHFDRLPPARVHRT